MRSMTNVMVAAALILAACAAPVDPGTDEAEVPLGDDDGKADGTTETRVRAGETSLWVRHEVRREARDDGREVLVVRGRTSRNLVDGSGFVFDDVKGDWAQRSPRTFEVTYPVDDAGLLEGQDHFVRLHFADRVLTARVVARARLTGFTGSGAYLVQDVAPVIHGGRTVWRVRGTASSVVTAVRASTPARSLTDLRILPGGKQLEIDLAVEDVTALIGSDGELAIELDTASGTRTKRARLALRLHRLGLTTGDAYEVWSQPVPCDPEVAACLAGLPAGALDTAACGEAIAVRACAGQGGGVVFDDVAYAAAWDAAQPALATLAADADALVGADRAVEYASIVAQSVEGALEALFGRQYPDAAARDAAASAAVEAVIDLAYARPLDLYGEPHAPAPDLASVRDSLADALLLYLDSIDLANTEFGRPLEVLARQYRARHVADLRAWRTEAEVGATSGATDVYLGRWLDPYVEIRVERATGAVTGVYFEID